MASNNNNTNNNSLSSNEEDNVLASLGTLRAETSNYESDLLRQATHQLAPTLQLGGGVGGGVGGGGVDTTTKNDVSAARSPHPPVVGFPDLSALLPFPHNHQTRKANRQVVTQVLTRLQRQLTTATTLNNVEQMRLLAMKQHMLWSLLAGQKKTPRLETAWNQQPEMDAKYQQHERSTTFVARSKPRGSMMQHKQIPGAASLAKATQQLTSKKQRRKQAWKDWSSDDDDSDNDTASGTSSRALLTEMNTSRRRRRDPRKPAAKKSTKSKASTKSKPSSVKVSMGRQQRTTTSRNTATKTRQTQQSTSSPTSTSSTTATNTTTAEPQGRIKRKRTIVNSYAENDSDQDNHENENDSDDDANQVHDTTTTTVKQEEMDPSLNDTQQNNGGPTNHNSDQSNDSTNHEEVTVKDEPKIMSDQDETTENLEEEQKIMSEQEGATTAKDEPITSSSATTTIACPICQTTWTARDPSSVDEELSQHMATCQASASNTTTTTTRRSGRAAARKAAEKIIHYNDKDDEEDLWEEEEEKQTTTTTTTQRSRQTKRKRSEPNDEYNDFDADKNESEKDDDNNFDFENDIDESDDEIMADEDEPEDIPLTKPTALDDYRLDDYEDRVDYWRLHGIGEMRDMSQLRAEGETDPGAMTFDGGLHIPAWMNNRLFGYQRTGLEWMWTLHQQQAGGVMGDEMGLGKTVQVSSFLGAMAASRKLKGVLIISPATMLQHWLSELAVWAPGLRRILLHASGDTNGSSSEIPATRNIASHGYAIFRNLRKWLKDARQDLLYEHIDNDDEDDEWPDDSFCGTGYAVVTTYEHVRRHQDLFVNHPWSYVVLDEAQKLKNPQADITLACKRLRTPHRIAMTGTPIQNDLRELWSLFDFVFPGRLGTLPAFEQEFADPIKRGGYSNASPVQVQLAYRCSLVLRDLIDPFLLRRQKSEIEEVRRMPSKTEHVLFCRLSKRQRRMYEAYLDSDVVKRIFKGSSLLFAAVTMLRKICNHPDLVLTDPSDEALEAFLRNGCVPDQPLDSDAEEDEDDVLGDCFPDAESDSDNLAQRSGKFEVLSRILPLWKEQGHRVLIFSQWTKMLNIIQKFVVSQGWKFARLDGKTNVASRQRLVDTFNNDESYFAMLCTTRTGGVGLNLTGANRIILYDVDWNPQTDAQARERAWRFGQERAVTVYRLCTTGTIEEKMYQRQIFKTALTNKVLHDPRQRRLFSQKDLHDLLTLQPDNGHARSGGEEVIETTNKIAKASNGGSLSTSEVSKDDGETLQSVLKSKGLAGVFDHNFVDSSASGGNKSASVREMEEQAKRIAREAAEALKASVDTPDEDDPFTPTWTGASESRFGGASSSGGTERRGSATSSFGGAGTAGVRNANGGSTSSGSLLASLRQNNAAVKSGGARRPSLTGSDSGSANSRKGNKFSKLMVQIRDYVRNNSPTTDELLDEFAFVPTADAAIFKRLLNSVARVERGRWNLLPEQR